jgi:DNA (cytosine-5)-methyltransferase 1
MKEKNPTGSGTQAPPLPVYQATKQGYIECEEGGCFDAAYPESKLRRGRVSDRGCVAPTLTAGGATDLNVYEGLSSKNPAMRADAHDREPSVSKKQDGTPKYRIRRLTPVETGRLMGMEDSDIQKMKDAGLSKSAMYKLHGNSIVVDVLYYVFKNMFITSQESVTEQPVQPDLFKEA